MFMDGEELVIDNGTAAGGGDSGGDTGGGSGDSGKASDAGAQSGTEELDLDFDFGDETEGDAAGKLDDETQLSDEDKAKAEADRVKTDEEKALVNFKGTVAGRIKALVKTAPELGQVFDKYPEVKEKVAAIFRREAALREVFPTVAEAHQMRDEFPNGMNDVRVLRQAETDLLELDNLYDKANPDGTYPGHSKMIENFVARDKNAAIALFRELPKAWAKTDRASYNEVFGQVIAATLHSRGIPKFLDTLFNTATEAENKDLAEGIDELRNWVKGYSLEKPAPSDEQKRIADERKALDAEKLNTNKERQNEFHKSFKAESTKLQLGFIKAHPAVKRIMESKLPSEKKNEIVEKIRLLGERSLAKSPSFMSTLRPAWGKRDMKTTLDIQRKAWNNPWALNRLVRQVLGAEIPTLVKSNREAFRRPAGSSKAANPGSAGGNKDGKRETPKGPRQVNGRWYKGDGTPFTTQEVVAGKHLQS